MIDVDRQSLQLDVLIEIEPDFDFSSAEYCELFDLKRATAFQSPLWLAAVHRDLALQLDARQRTVTIRSRTDRKLLAVLPLVVQKLGLLCVIQPADFGVCDSNAVIGDRELLERLAQSPDIRARIEKLLEGSSALIFRKVRRDGFDVRTLFNGSVASLCENAAYHSQTGSDFEVWQRKTISRKFSKELGRLGRQMERDFGLYEHRLVTTETEIRQAFALLQRCRKGRFTSDLMDNDIYTNFYLNFALAGAQTGEALTYMSYLNGEPVAVLFGVGYENQCHAVLIGADTDRYAKYSVGIQLLFRVVKLRFDRGLHRLDFGLGNTGYKSMFRVEEVLLDNISVSRSLAGAAMSFIYHNSKPVKNVLRKLIPNLR